MKQASKKILFALVGWAVLLLGVVMVPYPGPGWLVVFLGLSILARQFTWAYSLPWLDEVVSGAVVHYSGVVCASYVRNGGSNNLADEWLRRFKPVA